MVVLSLFDGMGCGMIALKELGVKVTKYYASEIDKFAIQQTKLNFPEVVHLGTVENCLNPNLIDLSTVDLVIAGSPCQGFSFAGKGLNFDDPRSKLFFVFAEIWEKVKMLNPDAHFFLENVNMKKEHLNVISKRLGVKPMRINSNLVSAQNRARWYWFSWCQKQTLGLFGNLESIPTIPAPKDKNIFLKDVLQPEEEIEGKYYLSEKFIKTSLDHKERHDQRGNGFGISPHFDTEVKAKAVTTLEGTRQTSNFVCVAMRGRNPDNPKSRKPGLQTVQMLEPKTDGKTNCLTTVSKDNLVLKFPVGPGPKKEVIQLNPSIESGNQPYQQNRIYDPNGLSPALLAQMSSGTHAILQRGRGFNKGGIHTEKTPTLTANAWHQNNHLLDGYTLRRLTPLECCRLQTIPEWYKWSVSNTQIYKMLGNGWTVEVIKHIFSFLPKECR